MKRGLALHCTALIRRPSEQRPRTGETFMGFAPSAMQLTSPAFAPLGRIPKHDTGEGLNVSPAFAWSGAPSGTKSFALICHDPHAPLAPAGRLWLRALGAVQHSGLGHGTRRRGEGPIRAAPTASAKAATVARCRPRATGTHHYYFWLLALNTATESPAGRAHARPLRPSGAAGARHESVDRHVFQTESRLSPRNGARIGGCQVSSRLSLRTTSRLGRAQHRRSTGERRRGRAPCRYRFAVYTT